MPTRHGVGTSACAGGKDGISLRGAQIVVAMSGITYLTVKNPGIALESQGQLGRAKEVTPCSASLRASGPCLQHSQATKASTASQRPRWSAGSRALSGSRQERRRTAASALISFRPPPQDDLPAQTLDQDLSSHGAFAFLAVHRRSSSSPSSPTSSRSPRTPHGPPSLTSTVAPTASDPSIRLRDRPLTDADTDADVSPPPPPPSWPCPASDRRWPPACFCCCSTAPRAAPPARRLRHQPLLPLPSSSRTTPASHGRFSGAASSPRCAHADP